MELVAAQRIDRPGGPRRRRLVGLAAALLAGATLAFGGAADGFIHETGRQFSEQAAYAAEHDGHDAADHSHPDSANVTMAGETLTIVARAGAADRIAAGSHELDLPPVLRMRVGQTIAIRNDDRLAHILFGEVVPPGQTVQWTLTQPGIEVYAAGCAAHVSGTGMTSLIVSPANERS